MIEVEDELEERERERAIKNVRAMKSRGLK
jgi:hypothetical protein